jgi:AraC-like DNA-binding protein
MRRAGVVTGVRLEDVARCCNLSLSRFGRTFKKTTGMPPHRWLAAMLRSLRLCSQLLRCWKASYLLA